MLDKKAHPNTRVMIEAWKRMDTTPVNLMMSHTATGEPTSLIHNIFVLREAGHDDWTFRTAGESLHRYFGKSVSSENFIDLWMGADRGLVSSAILAALSERSPAILRARGETLTGHQLGVEIALAPLESKPGHVRRILGHYQPLGGEGLIGERPIWRHIITEVRAPQRQPRRPHLRLVSSQD